MALGARPSIIVKMISREVAMLLAVGILLGVPAALLFHRSLASMLFQVSPGDVPAIAVAAVVLVIAGFAAAIVPGRRAASVTPVTALRYE
jgi:ABC-type antimicrobial peptide transport system permease subunit